MLPTITPRSKIQYIGYDKRTGAIVHTYSRLDVQKDQYVEVPIDQLKREVAKDPLVISRLSGNTIENLEFVKVEASEVSKHRGALFVDPKTQRLTVKPALQLKSDKTQLTGDGADKAMLEIQAVDGNGKPVRSLEGEVRVTTDRGKLSERGGIVKLAHGYGKLELTSVNETVRKVRVRAESLNGTAAPGEVVLEFV